MEGALAALFSGPDGELCVAPVHTVDISETGLAFRSNWHFIVGQTLLISDGADVVEVVIHHKREQDDQILYGVEALLSASLPAALKERVSETSLRLHEQMNLPSIPSGV